MWFELTVLFALILVNGLFSGAEIATVTVRKHRIEQLILEGKSSAKAIQELRANPERFLATVQVGITVVGAAAAAYGGDTLADRLVPYLTDLLGPYAHRVSFFIVVAGISYLSLVLGELVPKSLALRAGETYALLVARPLLALATVAEPVIWLLTRSSNVVLRIFGDRTSFTEARVSPDELKAMLEEASEIGTLHPRVGEIATRAIELSELRAGDVMVPRRRIQSASKDATVGELRALARSISHGRIPLVGASLDEVVGYVALRDVFNHPDDGAQLSSLARPLSFVPEGMRAVDLLQALQARGAGLAIVVDEHGGTAGLVTREDLAEELFGEVAVTPSAAGDHEIQRQPDGSVVLSGTAAVRDVNRALDVSLPESDDWTTIAGLCVGLAGRIPVKGERIPVPTGPELEVLDASPRRVRSVLLRAAAPAAEPPAS